MRKLIAVLLFATAAFAQEPPPQERSERVPPELASVMFNYQRRMETLAKAVSRDAFIVGRMAQATSDLQDFQKLSGLEKALDRVKEAQLRARENPRASGQTMTALGRIEDAVRRGREAGTAADANALIETILRESHDIQRDLFHGVQIARRERETLSDLQKKLMDLNLALETSMAEALGSTMEFLQAGGR